jgi:hypothetical protein
MAVHVYKAWGEYFGVVRVVVVDEPRKGFRRSALLLLSVLFVFLGIIAVVMYIAGLPAEYFHFVIFAYALFSVYVLARPLSVAYRGIIIRRVARHVYATDDGFSIDLSADYGFITVWSDGSNTNFSFAQHGTTDSVSQALVPETHFLALGPDGSGKIVLPAFVLNSFPVSGVVIAFFVSRYAVDVLRDHLSVSRANDRADLILEPTDYGMSGYIRYGFTRATKALVELSWHGFSFADTLLVAPDAQSFVYPRISEPIIVVSHESILTPRALRDALGVDTLLQGEGNFVIRLRMKVPLESDVIDEEPVYIVPRSI